VQQHRDQVTTVVLLDDLDSSTARM
jgi:hypothetical protein